MIRTILLGIAAIYFKDPSDSINDISKLEGIMNISLF